MCGEITKIEVDAPNGTMTMTTDPTEMTSRILQRNQRHFSQATGTPFTQEPITNWLGICGKTHTGIALAQGHDKPNLGDDPPFPETQVMLDALQPFDPPPATQYQFKSQQPITKTSFKNGMKAHPHHNQEYT
jgi:hypothetical protein